MEYLTTSEIGEKWSISRRRVSLLCAEGRIEGAVRKGHTWLVPAEAKKPEDPRRVIKNGEAFAKTISVGTWEIPELELRHGNNSLSVTSEGVTTFTYKEGRL